MDDVQSSDAQPSDKQGKLCFVRRGFFLKDPPGSGSSLVIHQVFFGERLTEEQKNSWISLVAKGDQRQQREAIEALWGERSTSYCRALLTAVTCGSFELAPELLRFADQQDEVRSALVDALKQAPLSRIEELASIVGRLGGEGALGSLRGRLHEAVEVVKSRRRSNPRSEFMSVLLTLSFSILRLDPDAGDAAECILSAYHATPLRERWTIVASIFEVLRDDLSTSPQKRLAEEMKKLPQSTDLSSLLVAARFLTQDSFEVMFDRVVGALRSGDVGHRGKAIIALASMPFPYGGRGLAVLASWLIHNKTDLNEALWIAGLVYDFLPADVVAKILDDALASVSPSMRFEVTGFIDKIAPTKDNLRKLEQALSEEPDPMLTRDMRRVLDAHGTCRVTDDGGVP